jgi:cyanophycin synthetase
MNVYDRLGFTVILDYGHNPAAVDAMCTLADNMAGGLRAGSKRIVAIAAPGDRRDEDIRAIAARAAKSFDVFVCKRDDNRRGRGDDEVPRLLAEELRARGVPEDRIHILPKEPEALDAALGLAAPGDLVLVFADQVTRCWKQIIYWGGNNPQATDLEGPAGGTAAAPATVTMASPVDAAGDAPADLAALGLVRDARGVLVAPTEEAD